MTTKVHSRQKRPTAVTLVFTIIKPTVTVKKAANIPLGEVKLPAANHVDWANLDK